MPAMLRSIPIPRTATTRRRRAALLSLGVRPKQGPRPLQAVLHYSYKADAKDVRFWRRNIKGALGVGFGCLSQTFQKGTPFYD